MHGAFFQTKDLRQILSNAYLQVVNGENRQEEARFHALYSWIYIKVFRVSKNAKRATKIVAQGWWQM